MLITTNSDTDKQPVGIVVPGYPGLDKGETDKSLEGAVAPCEEAHHDCAVVDDQRDFGGPAALLLPESITITPALGAKLTAYYRSGGRLLLTHRAGFDAAEQWVLPFLPLSFRGETDTWPTFWRARREFDAALSESDRLCYTRGRTRRLWAGSGSCIVSTHVSGKCGRRAILRCLNTVRETQKSPCRS